MFSGKFELKEPSNVCLDTTNLLMCINIKHVKLNV